jgi:hypothetical protein
VFLSAPLNEERPLKSGRVIVPVIGRYGGVSSELSLILDLVAREMARKHTAFYNIGFSEAKALFRQKLARKWGHAIARRWATFLLDRPRNFVLVTSSAGGNSSIIDQQRSGPFRTADITSMATLDLVCAALLFISTC